jgi:23S rRNA (pseudouridine1915-N3)-methyltransferase
LKLVILAVGHKMPDWITSGFEEYAKRMPPELRIELKELKPEQRSSSRNAESVMAAEKQRIEAALPKNARIIALDERGRDWTTMQLAQALPNWQQDGRDVAFIIGGADGLDPEIKSRAEIMLRISSLTLPHGMVRVLLAEQL